MTTFLLDLRLKILFERKIERKNTIKSITESKHLNKNGLILNRLPLVCKEESLQFRIIDKIFF